MGTRSGGATGPGGDRAFETNNEYALTPETDQLKRLEAWKPDATLFNAGTQAGYDQRTRDIKEGYGSPYSGISNPVVAARAQDLALQEASGQRAQALGDQDTAYQKMSYEPVATAAALRQGDNKLVKESGYGQKQQQQGGGFWSNLVGGAIGALI